MLTGDSFHVCAFWLNSLQCLVAKLGLFPPNSTKVHNSWIFWKHFLFILTFLVNVFLVITSIGILLHISEESHDSILDWPVHFRSSGSAVILTW